MAEKPIRVAVIINNFVVGGVSAVALGIFRNTPKDEVSYSFIKGSAAEYEPDEELKQLQVPVYTIPQKKPICCSIFTLWANDLRRAKYIYKLLKENGPFDVVHIHDFPFSGILAAKKAGIPMRILHSHLSTSEFYGAEKTSRITRIFMTIRQWFYLHYATHHVGTSLMSCYALFGEKALQKYTPIIINPGTNLKRYDINQYSVTDARAAFPSDEESIRLVHVGRFVAVKNQSFLLDVMCALKKKNQKADLFILGNGVLENDLKKKTEELHLTECVHFLPPGTNLPLLMRGCHFFLLPSFSEGFGLVLTDAQAMGLRCLASDTISQETNAGLVTYLPIDNTAELWAQTIISQHKEAPRKPDFQKLARFDEQHMADKAVRVYKGYKG